MDNTYIVETSSSEEEEYDSDGNDGWLKDDVQDVIYDPKTMFLDMKPKKLPNHAKTTDLTKTYKLLINSDDLIPLDKNGNEIEKDLPIEASESDKTHYSPQFIFGFRLDFNKLSHKPGGFKNVTELHIKDLYVNPVTSGDSVYGIHNDLSNIDIMNNRDIFNNHPNNDYDTLTMNITITNSELTTELAKRFVDYVKGSHAVTNDSQNTAVFTPYEFSLSQTASTVSAQETSVSDFIYQFLIIISNEGFNSQSTSTIGIIDIFSGINSLTMTIIISGATVYAFTALGIKYRYAIDRIENIHDLYKYDSIGIKTQTRFMDVGPTHPLHGHTDVFNHPVSLSVDFISLTPNYFLDNPIQPTKYVKLGQSSAYEYSLIKGKNILKSIYDLNTVQLNPIIYGLNTIYPGYLPRASYIDVVIEELPSVNQYQHNSRPVFERKHYKYHEDGSYKDTVSVIVNSTNLHEISLNRLTFKFYLSGSNKIYKQNTPLTTPPTYDELLPSSTNPTQSTQFQGAFPMLPSGGVLAVFHNDTIDYKQISMTITVKVKEN
jgi:hypothetical protein